MATKTKRKQIEQSESSAILNSVKGIQVSDVVSQISELQVTVQKTLADVSSTVTTKVHQVEEIDKAIELKNQRLKELFNIELEAFSLEEMKAQKEQERLDWELERQLRKKRMEEEEAEHIKAKNRLEDNWKYEFDQKKKRAQEEFDVEMARVKRNEALRHETLERGWIERENALKAREQEFQNLQTQVAGFEAKVQESVKKAETAGYASASAKFNHEIALLKKDSENEKKVAEMRTVALTSQIENLENQIEEMHKQLISARQDAKEVASEALKSASSRQLADTLQKVVTDSQQGNGKSK